MMTVDAGKTGWGQGRRYRPTAVTVEFQNKMDVYFSASPIFFLDATMSDIFPPSLSEVNVL